MREAKAGWVTDGAEMEQSRSKGLKVLISWFGTPGRWHKAGA